MRGERLFQLVRGLRPGKPGRQTAGASSRTPHGIEANSRREAKHLRRVQHATTPARESGALGSPVLCPYNIKITIWGCRM